MHLSSLRSWRSSWFVSAVWRYRLQRQAPRSESPAAGKSRWQTIRRDSYDEEYRAPGFIARLGNHRRHRHRLFRIRGHPQFSPELRSLFLTIGVICGDLLAWPLMRIFPPGTIRGCGRSLPVRSRATRGIPCAPPVPSFQTAYASFAYPLGTGRQRALFPPISLC
jgi:hypothetical protein